MKKIYKDTFHLLKNNFSSRFVFQNLFLPNTIITCYFGIIAILLLNSFPINVNLYFTIQMFFLSLFPLMVWVIVLIFLAIFKKDHSIKNKIFHNHDSSKNLFFILIPLVPIINYLYNNQESLSIKDSIILLFFFIVLLFVFIYMLPKLLKNYLSSRNLISLTAAFFFSIFNMASMSGYFSWLEMGELQIQLIAFLLVFLILWLVYGIKNHREVMLLILVFFCGNIVLLIIPKNNVSANHLLPSDSFQENKLLNLVNGKEIQIKPNIYLLVYDAYVTNETMNFYGIENSEQEIFLEELGFVIYPNTYSVGAHTLSTMNKILNVSIDYYGQIRRGVSGDGIVQKILKKNNYKIFGIFPNDYMFRVTKPSYDVHFPEVVMPSYKILLIGVFMGEFRFDTGLDTVSHEEYVNTKHEIFTQKDASPFFIYTHSDLPNHSQNSGVCLENELELYIKRLREANVEMKKDVSIIIENDPDGIIIVAGDHGPYITKNCYSTLGVYSSSEISRRDIQDRFGTFLAIKWPSDDYKIYDEIEVLQDIFPSIFSYLYKDLDLLESKIDPNIVDSEAISGVSVESGVIKGGMNDGETLFLNNNEIH